MNISDYRREYQACCAALERARYKYHAGLEPQLRLQPIHDRYAELHTPEAVNDLQRAWDQTPAYAETERASLRALLSAARLAYGEARAAAATEELKRCEEAAHIEWDGASVAARDMLTRIADEPEAVRRRDLAARWADALGRCNDLRAARRQSLRDSAQTLGLPHARALYEEAANTDHERLAATAADFLERTAPAYTAHLSQWTARHLPAELQSNLAHADYLFLARAAYLDAFFPGRELLATYTGAMNNLGISVEKQTNIHVNDAPPSSELKRTHCYAIHPRTTCGSSSSPRTAQSTSLRYFVRQVAHSISVGYRLTWRSGIPSLFMPPTKQLKLASLACSPASFTTRHGPVSNWGLGREKPVALRARSRSSKRTMFAGARLC